MKVQLWGPERKSRTSIAISLAVHVLIAAGLMAITFHYPIQDLFIRPDPPKAIPVKYVRLAPKTGAVAAAVRAPRAAAPAQSLPRVSSIPTGIPAPATAPVPAPSSMAIGAGGAAPSGGGAIDPRIGVGIRPGIPDGRLATNPMSAQRAPQTEGEKAERALAAIYGEYLDSARAAMAHPQREAGDWSWGGKDGDKWGWDKDGIHIGGISIPNVVLAALPLNLGPTGRNVNAITDARTDAFMRSDIQMHAQVMSEDEFRAAVKRVRERVDRERREKMEKQKAKDAKSPPCC